MHANREREFGAALARHFGLKNAIGLKINCERGAMFSATVDVALTTDDLRAIAALMDGKAPESEQEPVSAHFDPPASDDDLKRFMQIDGKNYLVVNVSPPDGATASEFADLARNQLNRAMKRNP